MFCESCGASIPDGQAFCSNCGAAAPAQAAPVQAAPVQPAPAPAPQPMAQPVQPVQQYVQPAPQPVQPVQQYAQPVQQAQPVYVQPVVAVPAQPRKSSGMAIAGLIMGIFTLIFCWVPVVSWILGLLGLIFSIIGIAKKNGGAKGAAIAGLVLTILGAIIGIALYGLVLGTSMNEYLEQAEYAASSVAAETSY